MCQKHKSVSFKPSRPSVNSIDKNTTDNSVNPILKSNDNPECEPDYDSLDENLVATIASNTLQIE